MSSSSILRANKIFSQKLFSFVSKKNLSLNEHHCKKLLADNNVAVQRFFLIKTKQDIEDFNASTSKFDEYVVKAQVNAGGRGKGHFISPPLKNNGGGVQLTTDKNTAVDLAKNMLHNVLVTAQTTAEGLPVNEVMIGDALPITKETYLAFVLDRDSTKPMLIASPIGGVDIEKVAEEQPDKVLKLQVDDLKNGLSTPQINRVTDFLEFEQEKTKAQVKKHLVQLYKVFVEADCLQLEINPFGVTDKHDIMCFDSKINMDDNAVYRQIKKQTNIKLTEEMNEMSPDELIAAQNQLNYVPLGGNGDIACMVNGAGLAMATMDIIKYCGGEPANFLDIGGGVNDVTVGAGFDIIANNKSVKSIFVNIFGGIVNCGIVARGILSAYERHPNMPPSVVRLEGNSAETANELLKNHPKIDLVSDMLTAASRAVNHGEKSA